MMSNDATFGDFFVNACDSYLEVTSCRECSTAIFEKSAGSEMFESRQDENRRMMDDDLSSRQPRNVFYDDSISSSRLLLPFLPVRKSEGGVGSTNIRRRLHTGGDDIFRSKRARRDPAGSDYDEFCKLSRCRAWSQDDSQNSGIVSSSSNSESSETTLKAIHWEATLGDTNDLDKLIFI